MQRTYVESAEDQKVVDWLAPPDPWSKHADARARHEDGTGQWLLASDEYLEWKALQNRILWLHGKPGCGKTVLCSSIVEDLRALCKKSSSIQLAAFYFSFSDTRKQSYVEMLASLIVQLRRNERTAARLQQGWQQVYPSRPPQGLLEEIFQITVQQYGRVMLVLDALDEVPNDGDNRHSVLMWLRDTLRTQPNVQFFLTSRQIPDLHSAFAELKAPEITVSSTLANEDIDKYVNAEMFKDKRLRSLECDLKAKILSSFRQKADGMFRWAYCQMEELKRLKIWRPKYIKQVINAFPRGLDATYERKLQQIDDMYREETYKALRWLAFETRPITMLELSEACLIDIDGEGRVDVDNRGSIAGILELLADFVIVETAWMNEHGRVYGSHQISEEDDNYEEMTNLMKVPVYNSHEIVDRNRVRLAHFSVKEYLISPRIKHGKAAAFWMDEKREANILAQSCAAYLLHLSRTVQRPLRWIHNDSIEFPFVRYAGFAWPLYARRSVP
ncbi:hypothetical protein LTR95_010613 [Oleoguttula sp. CCFEE 5521]